MVSTALPRGGWTPLMYAARQGAIDGARALADGGADLNLKDPDGTTALVLAIINAHYDLAAMLLEKGADPNVADSAGMAAVYALVDMNTLGNMQGRPQPKLESKITPAGPAPAADQEGREPEPAAAAADPRPLSRLGRRGVGRGLDAAAARGQDG